MFTAYAVVAGEELGTGEGRSKKEAEQRAAEVAWRALRERSGEPTDDPVPSPPPPAMPDGSGPLADPTGALPTARARGIAGRA
jgi:ribonuclease-3